MDMHKSFNQIIGGLQEEEGMSAIIADIDKLFASFPDIEILKFFSDSIHPNDKGCRVIADFLYSTIY